MSVNNGFINRPVLMEASTGDIEKALGETSGDLGTLCTSSKINKWAKFKPIVFAQVEPLTEAQFRSVNYGLTAPSQKTNVTSTMNDTWAYTKPSGASSSPYRQTDFEHYSHNAKNPIRENGNIEANMYFSTGVTFYFTQTGTIDQYAIAVTDLTALSSFYPAVYITYTVGSQNYIQIITASATFGDGGNQVTIPRASFSTPNYQAVRNYYLVASSVKYPNLTDTFVSGYFKCLPFKSSINELKGTISWETTWRLGFSITHVSNFTSWTSGSSGSISQMLSASDYTRVMPSGGGDQYYFGVVNSGRYNLQLKCTVTNNYSYAVTLNVGQMTYKLNQTFADSQGSGTMSVKAIYNSSGNSVNSVSLNAGASATIVIALQDDALRMDRNNQVITYPTTGQKIAETIQFLYNANNVFTLQIRLRN